MVTICATLHLAAWLQIFSHTVSLSISELITVVALLLAVDQYRKNRTSRQAVADPKHSLFKQRSAQGFDEISRKAATLSAVLLSKNWTEATQLVAALGGLIASASGFSSSLLQEDDEIILETAATRLKSILGNEIPVTAANAFPDDKVKDLIATASSRS